MCQDQEPLMVLNQYSSYLLFSFYIKITSLSKPNDFPIFFYLFLRKMLSISYFVGSGLADYGIFVKSDLFP